MNGNEFVSHTVVKSAWEREPELCRAIDESRSSFAEFVKAFEQREVRQTDFIVTVMRRNEAKLVPVGVLVESIQGQIIRGREVPNTLTLDPGGQTTCALDDVISWRYVDTFELVGGRLYRVLFHRQRWPVQRTIEDEQPFLLEWDKNVEKDVEFRDFLRDVANLRYAEVERKLNADKSLHHKEAFVPRPEGINMRRRIKLKRRTTSDDAATLGDARMIKLLHSLGVLHENERKDPPLVTSACQGNLEATRCMLELGFDVEVSDDRDGAPLEYAVSWDHDNVVALLLKHGANCNRRDNRRRTPIFHVKSVVVAKQLLAAGARLDLLDDQNETCVQHHLEYGRSDIVSLLVKHGAKREPHWELGLNEVQTIERGGEVLKQHFQATDPQGLTDFELGKTTNYGCILPIRDIPTRTENNP